MKKLTFIFLALMCCMSIFATTYLVESGTPGAATWTGDPQGTTIINLTVEGQTLNAWFSSVTFDQEDEVWIAAGTYVLDGAIQMQRTTDYVNNKSYSVYGGFSGSETSLSDRQKGVDPWSFTNETILDGDNTYQIVFSPDINNGGYYDATNNKIWLFDGLTFTQGYGANGGAIDGKGAIAVQNCKFINNTSTTSGGGFHAAGQFVRLSGCLFSSNTALTNGGGAYVSGDRPYGVNNCVFEFNTLTSTGNGAGGGLYFNDNSGIAEFGIIKECIFRGNSGMWFGGALYVKANRIENCIIVNNAGLRSGPANYKNTVVVDTRGNFINCTFANNAGGMRLSGNPTFTNTIIWNNTNTYETAPANGIFTNCAYNVVPTGDWVSGADNITLGDDNGTAVNFSNPTTFVGLPADDTQKTELLDAEWKLTSTSPCIDEGITTDVVTDFWGTKRPQMNAFDIGAHEFPCTNKPTVVLTASSESVCEGESVELSLALTGNAPWDVVYTAGNGENDTIKNIATSPYVFNVTPSETTNYSIVSVLVDGCENENPEASLIVVVNPTYVTPVSETITEGETYDFFGTLLDEAGDYSHTLNTIHECDSVINLTLTVQKLPSSITMIPQEVEIAIGEQSTLSVTVLPDDAFDKSVTWISRNPSIATVNNNGEVTGVSAGEVYVVAVTVNEMKDSCEVTVKVPTSDIDFGTTPTIDVFPNPATDYLIIQTGEQQINSAKLFNLIGYEVLEINSIINRKGKTRIDMSKLDSGTYLLYMKIEDEFVVKKIMKK